MTTVFLDAHKVPLDPCTAASGVGLHTDQHGGAKVSHIGGGGDGDDDGCDGTGYSIDDLVAEDADDAGGSYNRGGGVAA